MENLFKKEPLFYSALIQKILMNFEFKKALNLNREKE
jgi:hypothetical protein